MENTEKSIKLLFKTSSYGELKNKCKDTKEAKKNMEQNIRNLDGVVIYNPGNKTKI